MRHARMAAFAHAGSSRRVAADPCAAAARVIRDPPDAPQRFTCSIASGTCDEVWCWHGFRNPIRQARRRRALIEETGIESVAEVIVAYLAQHPAAADSPQGIAQWWLPAMGVDVPVATVCKALDLLERRGAVSRTTLPGGPAIYRATTARTGAAADPETNGG
jgi:hypothetical protein